jgi:hypothetical protein
MVDLVRHQTAQLERKFRKYSRWRQVVKGFEVGFAQLTVFFMNLYKVRIPESGEDGLDSGSWILKTNC